jgi:Universal stress protein UspA and related nucleotide-binding proteins
MSPEVLKERATTDAPTAISRRLFRPGAAFNLLLAIDEDDNAPAAIRFANALSTRGAVPSVIRSLELLSMVTGTGDGTVLFLETALGADFYQRQLQMLRSRIERVLGRNPGWPTKTVVGEAAEAIVRATVEEKADALLIGVHHHGVVGQALGENTATKVMSKSVIPVLGVHRDATAMPRRIMVATDFGQASNDAAELAANLADPGGVVILVHTRLPAPLVEEGDEGAALVEREGVEHAFAHLSERLLRGRAIRVETVTRVGDAAQQLLAAADEIGPDLIAVARQRHSMVTRLMLGSVSRAVVRGSKTSVLVTPPRRQT